MSLKTPVHGVWANENIESTNVDKIWHYLDQLFWPNPDPNGMFLYDRGDPLSEDNGAHLFSGVTHTKGYQRISQGEVDLYKTHSYILENILDEKTRNIIDMWCWDGEKSAQVLQEALGGKLAGKTYIPADISPYFVDHAGENVQKTFSQKNTNIKTFGLNIDFLTSDAFKDIKHKIYVLLGGSIGNFSDTEIVQIFKNMADSTYKEKSKAAVTYFTAPDKNSDTYQDELHKMLAAYGDPDSTNPYFDEETHRKTVERIIRWFESLGIERNSIEFCVKYDEINKRILSGVKVKKRIVIKRHGKNYLKEPGEHIRAIQSRRFTEEDISSLIEQAWGNVINSTPLQQWIATISFEVWKSAEAKEKRKKTTANTFKAMLVGALLATGTWVGMQLQKTQAKKKSKERSEQVTIDKWKNKDFNIPNSEYSSAGKDSVSVIKNLQETVDGFYKNIEARYNPPKENEELIKSFLTDIIESENAVFRGQQFSQRAMHYMADADPRDALVDKIIQDHPRMMKKLGIDRLPFQSFIRYKDALVNTILTTKRIDTIKADNQNIIEQSARGWSYISPTFPLWEVRLPYMMIQADLVRKTIGGKHYILARVDEDQEWNSLSLQNAKEACSAILMQWHPTVRSFMETYLAYYPEREHEIHPYSKFEAIHSFLELMMKKYNTLPDHVTKEEIHQIIRTHMLTTDAYKWMERYNATDTMKNYIPRDHHYHRDGLEISSPSYIKGNIYEMSDGTQYRVEEIRLDGENYLVAKKIVKYEDPLNEYTTENANKVLEDYRKLKTTLTKN